MRDRRELPPPYTHEFYKLNEETESGKIFATAVMNRYRSIEWNTAFIRLGDEWFKPRLTEA